MKTQKKEMKKAKRSAFIRYLQLGETALTREERSLLQNRALSHTVSEGGAIVPAQFANLLEAALRNESFFDVATVLETEKGGKLPYPTMNDSSNTGELLVENASMGSSADPVFGQKLLGAYKFSSKPVNISNELIQDAPEVFLPVLAEKLAERCVKAAMPYFISGTGTNQPTGFLTAGAKGVDAAVSALSYANLLGLIKSVDKRFRAGASWAMNDNTLLTLQQLADSAGNPIVKLAYNEKQKPMMLGYPINILNDMDDIGAGNISVAFGNFQKYIVRRIKGAAVLRLEETFADLDQTAFVLYLRMDGNLVDVSSTLSPVKYIEHAAS